MRREIAAALAALTMFGGAAFAQDAAPAPQNSSKTFAEAVKQVMARPVYRHGRFGLEVWSLDQGKPVFAVDGDKLFTPGSTTKLFTEGAALRATAAELAADSPEDWNGRRHWR